MNSRICRPKSALRSPWLISTRRLSLSGLQSTAVLDPSLGRSFRRTGRLHGDGTLLAALRAGRLFPPAVLILTTPSAGILGSIGARFDHLTQQRSRQEALAIGRVKD